MKLCQKLLSVSERFVNLFTSDIDARRKVVDSVWKILQDSYAAIGGIKGSGFSSKDDMVKNIAFWKLVRKDGKIIAASFYKDKQGRKRVAVATDGTAEGKKALAKMMIEDLEQGRSWGEVSGPSWKFIKRNFPDLELLKSMVLPVDKVKKLLGDEIQELEPSEVPAEGDFSKFFYKRMIGGHAHLKIALGVPGVALK